MGSGSPRCTRASPRKLLDLHPIAAMVLLCTAGCVDPRADYDEFAQRPYARADAAAAQRSLTPCAQLLAKDPSGTYFASCLSIDLMLAFALAFQQRVTVDTEGTRATLELSFTPLVENATDISQTTGQLYTLAPTPISAECLYDQPVGDLVLPKEGNALGRDVAALNMRLRGRLLSETRACALLSGEVPLLNLMLNKDEDVCVFVRRDPGEPLPTLAVPADYGCDATGLPKP